MKLGYKRRRLLIKAKKGTKKIFSLAMYLSWLIFSVHKFRRIKKIDRLLVVWTGKTIGDLYLTIGMLNRLTTLYPNLSVFFLTRKENWVHVKNPKIHLVDEDALKNLNIDAVITFSAIEKKIYKDIKYRVGLDEVNLRHLFRQRIMPSTRRIFPSELGALRMFKTFKVLGLDLGGKLEFYYTKEAEEYAEKFYKALRKPVIFIHIGSKGFALKNSSKYWDLDNWVEVANKLIELYNPTLVFTGVGAEEEAVNKLISLINKSHRDSLKSIVNLPMETIASLLKRGDLMISIDTGIVHVAAQAGIPLVDIYRSDTKRAWPWTEKKSMIFHPELCNDCEKDYCPEGAPICSSSITPAEVLTEVKKWLGAKEFKN